MNEVDLTRSLRAAVLVGNALANEILSGNVVGHEDDPVLAENELLVYLPGPEGEEPCFRIRIEPCSGEPAEVKRPRQGINPVTIRTEGQPHLTLSRLHIGDGNTIKKNLTVALFPEDGTLPGACVTVVDEDKFIDAMGHLFPRGELCP